MIKSASRLIALSFMACPPLQIISARPVYHNARAAMVCPNRCMRRAPNKPWQAIQKRKASNAAQNVPDHILFPFSSARGAMFHCQADSVGYEAAAGGGFPCIGTP